MSQMLGHTLLRYVVEGRQCLVEQQDIRMLHTLT